MAALFAFTTAGFLLSASVLLSLAFFIYGFNTLHLTIRSKRYKPKGSVQSTGKPTVAIHLPIYNELYVIGRLLGSCVAMAERYGKDLVRIYVIDDSTDETGAEVDRLVSQYESEGFRLAVIRRGTRAGFKAGALQAALNETDEEFVAVLDADFVPNPDFLDRTVPQLQHDPTVGFVQGRWSHLDRGYNIVTESLAIGIDAHFILEQRGRNGSGYLMNFNGSAGVLRVKAILEAGGWASDTLAEDLDLSYRVQLAGYRGVYLNDVEVPAELPPTITGLKRQQGRWARGSIQAAKKLLGPIGKSKKLTVGQKVEAGVHLTYYLVHPLMVASFLIAVAADFLSIDVAHYYIPISLPALLAGGGAAGASLALVTIEAAPWLVFSALVILSTFAVLFYCIEAVRAQGLGLKENVRKIAFLVILGYGISISNSVQALSGLLSPSTGTFQRTPKYAIERTAHTWKDKKYQLPFNGTTLLEAGAVALAVLATARAYITGNLGLVPILLVYLLGYSFVLYLTLRQVMGSSGARDS